MMERFTFLWERIKRLLGRSPGEDDDPYARVRQPVRKSPPGRAAAVAIEEP